VCLRVELQEGKFLVYISGKQGEVRGISFNASTGTADVMVPIQSSLRPVALATHAATRSIYFSDADRRKVVRRKLEFSDSQIEDVLVGGVCDEALGRCLYIETAALLTKSLVTNMMRPLVMCTGVFRNPEC
jgi:hypothetical protein